MVQGKDFNQEPNEEKISRINSAGLINITTENLWRESYSAMAKGDLLTWNRKLDALWLVFGGDTGKGSIEEKEFLRIELELHKLGSLNHKTYGFTTNQANVSTIIAKQYLILREKALFLRRLQNKQGKGTAYDSGDDDDFE